MSKKVTAVSKTVVVGSQYVFLASDGTVRYGQAPSDKSEDVTKYETAVTKQGLKNLAKAMPIIEELEGKDKLVDKLDTLGGDSSDVGELDFLDDDNNPCVRVGCTIVYPNDLPAVIKQLGLKI